MIALEFAVSLLPIALGFTILAAAFVGFIRWINRREAGETFAEQYIPENADVAAIEASLPKFRGRT